MLRDVPQLTVWHHTDNNVSIAVVWCAIFYIVWGATLTKYGLCPRPRLTHYTGSDLSVAPMCNHHLYVYARHLCSASGVGLQFVMFTSLRCLALGALFKWMIVTVLKVVWAIFSDTLHCVTCCIDSSRLRLTVIIRLTDVCVCAFCFRHLWQQSRGFEQQICVCILTMWFSVLAHSELSLQYNAWLCKWSDELYAFHTSKNFNLYWHKNVSSASVTCTAYQHQKVSQEVAPPF
jgi:hypothetical protein